MIDYISQHDIIVALILIIIGCVIYTFIVFCKKFPPTTKFYLSSLTCFFIGLGFLITAVILKGHPIRSSIYLALGTILIFSVAYTAYSECRLSKAIISDVEKLIDDKLPINLSIIHYGLNSIEKFDKSKLLNRILSSHDCKYIVLYSLNFFKTNYEILEQFAQSHRLNIVITDPNHLNTIRSLEDSFEPRNQDEVKSHIEQSKRYVCQNICKNGLNKQNVKVYFVNRVLTYSAYIFDEKEFWLCPRQSTKSKKDGIVFVFKNNLENNFYYKDSIDVISSAQSCCSSCGNET